MNLTIMNPNIYLEILDYRLRRYLTSLSLRGVTHNMRCLFGEHFGNWVIYNKNHSVYVMNQLRYDQ